MQMTFKRHFGVNSYTFTVEGNNLFELVTEMQKMGFRDVFNCGKCKSDKLYPYAYVTEKGGFKYVKLVCAECKANVTFGRVKDDDAIFFLRRTEDGELDWQEKFEGDANGKGKGKKAKKSDEEDL